MRNRLSWSFGLLVAVAGCGAQPTVTAEDSGGTDAGRDASVPFDTGSEEDTGTPPEDTGPTDDAFVAIDAFGESDAAVTTGCELTGYPALDADELRGSGDLVTALVTAPGRDEIFVVERGGRIRIMDSASGAVLPTPFLTVALGSTPSGGDEQGLLGLAFHPDYETNGLFYVAYSPLSTPYRNRVAVGHRSTGSADVADATVTDILVVPDPFWNHNGGQLAFGPDGYLYVGLGDGGDGGDPGNRAENTDELLGKILRLDVTDTGYTSPATNPFVGGAGADEVWAYGLRNPWRFSFDSLTGDLWIADVGQGAWEEIDFVAAGTGAGDHFGWDTCEGTHDFEGSCAGLAAHHAPIYEYRHGGGAPIRGSSITGGYVYRGGAIPGLNGAYVFGDATNGIVAALRYCDGAVREPEILDGVTEICNATTFGQDANGEILIGCYDGRVMRIVPG